MMDTRDRLEEVGRVLDANKGTWQPDGKQLLDDYISRFRFKPIWVTEASNNKAGTSTYHKGLQYLDFWRELQKRPTVQGVTYFVASASNPEFKEEVWVGRNIAEIVGRR
jgi:hypothetical protein